MVYGTVEASLTDRTLLRVSAGYQANRPTASTWGGALGTGWFNNGQEIDWPRSYNAAPKWSQWNSTTQSHFATVDHQFENGWTGQIGYARSKQEYDAKLRMSLDGLIDPDTWNTTASDVYSNWFEGARTQNSVNAKLDGDFNLFGRRHEFMTGGSGTWQSNQGTVRKPISRTDYTGSLKDWNGSYPNPVWGEKVPELDDRTRQIGLYTAVRFSLADPLKVIVGARYTNWNNSLIRTFEVVSPYAGVVFDVNDNLSVYASYTDISQPQSNQDASGKIWIPSKARTTRLALRARSSTSA